MPFYSLRHLPKGLRGYAGAGSSRAHSAVRSDAPIFARTSGYVKKWYADIGTHVRQGQDLADIETPEVDQQLQQARADLDTAKANLSLSTITADRYLALSGKGAVAKQDTDDKVGDMNAKKAIVDSAAANVRRLEQLQGFEKVLAPFDGVITARNTDVGQLVDAGSSSTGKELFHCRPPARSVYLSAFPKNTNAQPSMAPPWPGH